MNEEEPPRAETDAEWSRSFWGAAARARRASSRALAWSVVSVGFAAFAFGFSLRGFLDGMGH